MIHSSSCVYIVAGLLAGDSGQLGTRTRARYTCLSVPLVAVVVVVALDVGGTHCWCYTVLVFKWRDWSTTATIRSLWDKPINSLSTHLSDLEEEGKDLTTSRTVYNMNMR